MEKKLVTKITAIFLFAALAAVLGMTIVGWQYKFACEKYLIPEPGMDGGLYLGLQEFEDLLLPTVIAAPVIMIILTVYLICVEGHRVGEDRILPNLQDRIPTDLYFMIIVVTLSIVGGGGVSLIEDIFSFYGSCANEWLNGESFSATQLLWLLPIGAGTTMGVALIVLAGVLTVAARIKLHTFFKNTVIYRVFAGITEILMNFTGSAKWVVVFSVMQAINLLLILLAMQDGLMLLFGLAGIVSLNGYAIIRIFRATKHLKQIKEGTLRIRLGDSNYKINSAGMAGELRELAEIVNCLGNGIHAAVEKQMKSERMKTELITNVSHDIKTPVTSIVSYARLLSEEKLTEKQREYAEVIDRQSMRLKKLTEDIVEASKASSGALEVQLAPVDLCELARQAAGEYEEKFARAGLEFVCVIPDEKRYVMADGRFLWRVIDNLLANACKYSAKGTRVYFLETSETEYESISVKNISKRMLNMPADELLERFARGDESRNEEGSGLGLSIARSLTELQNGRLNLMIDGDLFKATASFRKTEKPSGSEQ